PLNMKHLMDITTYKDEVDKYKKTDSFVTLSSTSKGDNLEFIVFRILKKVMKIDCQRVRLSGPYGDGGIDIFGNYVGYLILVQYKNYDEKVDVSDIRKFEGVAIERAETSKFNLLLTNLSNIQQDILDYVSETLSNFSSDSKDPEERIIDEIIGKIEQKIHAIDEKFSPLVCA
ncbi:32203_t:CDS:2, partial [Racocetra persica]